MQKLLTLQEVSVLLEVKPSTIYQWTHQGFIPHVKLGRLLRFKEADIVNWIEKRSAAGRATRKLPTAELGVWPSAYIYIVRFSGLLCCALYNNCQNSLLRRALQPNRIVTWKIKREHQWDRQSATWESRRSGILSSSLPPSDGQPLILVYDITTCGVAGRI